MRRRNKGLALLAATLINVSLWGCTSEGPVVTGDCMEDMPCWDCETMGNKRCGPMVNGAQAQEAAYKRQIVLGDDWQCWAEINLMQVEGYEVICTVYS